MTLITWLVILFLITVNALYVAAEFASVSVRRSRIRQLVEEGNRFDERVANQSARVVPGNQARAHDSDVKRSHGRRRA